MIYPLGYTLYNLKGFFGSYTYDEILILLRVISAILGTATILLVFFFMRKFSGGKSGLIAASLLAVAMMPVTNGHYGTTDNLITLAFILIVLRSYDLFDVNQPDSALNWGTCCLFGFIWGWALPSNGRWFLVVMPAFFGLTFSVFCKPKIIPWLLFWKTNLKRITLICAVAAVSFLAGIPDFQLAPKTVLDGLQYEMIHQQTGSYGQASQQTLSSEFNELSETL